jgi:hypothetical protein
VKKWKFGNTLLWVEEMNGKLGMLDKGVPQLQKSQTTSQCQIIPCLVVPIRKWNLIFATRLQLHVVVAFCDSIFKRFVMISGDNNSGTHC